MPVPSRVASLHHISQPSVRAGQERGCDATKGINWIKFAFGRIEIPVSPPRNGLVSFSCLSRPFHSRQRKVGSTLWRARDPGANIACICQLHFPKMGALIERPLSRLVPPPASNFRPHLRTHFSHKTFFPALIIRRVCRPIRWEKAGNFATLSPVDWTRATASQLFSYLRSLSCPTRDWSVQIWSRVRDDGWR